MAQLNATDVRIFPISNRTENTGNNFATEYNIASIINQLTGSTGFVITEEFVAEGEFSFNIAGYCFTVSQGSLLTGLAGEDDTALYAYITFSNTGSKDYQKISGGDAAVKTSFVSFTTSWDEFSKAGNVGIALLRRMDMKWKIPDESRIKFIPHKDFNIDNGRIK